MPVYTSPGQAYVSVVIGIKANLGEPNARGLSSSLRRNNHAATALPVRLARAWKLTFNKHPSKTGWFTVSVHTKKKKKMDLRQIYNYETSSTKSDGLLSARGYFFLLNFFFFLQSKWIVLCTGGELGATCLHLKHLRKKKSKNKKIKSEFAAATETTIESLVLPQGQLFGRRAEDSH